ncbi:MAG: ATP-binding cassette domain-containing protein [Paludibacter sp.]|nr:ATP-binding cassette domain-containing protein [Paludibacter sp.]
MNYIFDIKNLKCAYQTDKVVLDVKQLQIPFGKIVFVVGESGIGKSTILETLGLMNNTIISEPDTLLNYRATPVSEDVNILDLWGEKGDKRLSRFRLNNFSFIFQQTNLMRNFTAYENIAITRMLQGKSRGESITRTKEALTALGLSQIDHKREVFELSGGQQQRLAFARAIVPDFSVLFGDEPTGNLDPVTAEKVMTILKNQLKDEKSNHRDATAIIVSHSIDLAIEFGDLIVKIHSVPRENNPDRYYGVIDEKSIYDKRDGVWFSHAGKHSDNELQLVLKYNGK